MTVTQEKRRLKMLFYTWMIKNHLKDNSAKGLLARSMKAEGNGFPKRRRLKTPVGYLEHRGVSQEVMDALVACWEEYENHERESHRTEAG